MLDFMALLGGRLWSASLVSKLGTAVLEGLIFSISELAMVERSSEGEEWGALILLLEEIPQLHPKYPRTLHQAIASRYGHK